MNAPGPVVVSVTLSPEQVEAIALRAADILEERQRARAPVPAGTGPWLTVGEAAEYLRCPKSYVYDLRCQRRLTPHKRGSRALVARDELDAHLRGEPTGPLAEQVRGTNRPGRR